MGMEDVLSKAMEKKEKSKEIMDKKKEITHPTKDIFEETMKVIKEGNFSGIWNLDEEEEKSFRILENAIKKITYNIVDIKEENEISILSVNFKVPNLSKVKGKLFERIQNSKSILSMKDESEIEKISLEWFKEIVDEEINGVNLNRKFKLIDIKYVKNGEEWNIEDDSEFVKIFGFEMEEQIKRDGYQKDNCFQI